MLRPIGFGHFIGSVALLLGLGGVAYLAAAIACVRSRRPPPVNRDDFAPPVTVLKPVCGAEPLLYENLRSFCDQTYPAYQVIFGVRDPGDPAVPIIRRLMEEFSERDIELVIDNRVSAANLKIANLLNMVGRAKHDMFIVSDSDMRVDGDYLRSLVAPFADRAVGAATCLYSATPAGGVASMLGAMFINDHFSPSVLVALTMQKLRFCLGATMAVRRDVLESIGGFAALSGHLADDYMLGKLVSDRGFKVALASYAVNNIVHEPTLKSLLLHELRWARTIHAVRPVGHTLSFITYALPVSFIALLVSRNMAAGSALIAACLALRVVLHYVARRAFHVRAPATPWLIPVRDFLALGVWAASFFGRAVQWRGHEFRLRGGDLLAPE